jgi:hypothetical protein
VRAVQLELELHLVAVVETVHRYEVESSPGVFEPRTLTWLKWMCSCGTSAHAGTVWP